MSRPATTFAHRLDALLKEQGMNNFQLARATGLSRQQVGRLRKGLQQPTLTTLQKIATALHLPVETLVR